MHEQVLIIGNGRAGKRHAKHAKMLGLVPSTADPYAPADYADWRVALYDGVWDYIVIASPPDEHLEQIMVCLEHNPNMPILCEKPLVGKGQYNFGKRMLIDTPVMVSYNYRWNSAINNIKNIVDNCQIEPSGDWLLESYQYRVLPAWKLLYDHCPHGIDMLNYIIGINNVINAKHSMVDDMESWSIKLKLSNGKILTYNESIKNEPRYAKLSSPHGIIDINGSDEMFLDMWQDFLSRDFSRSNANTALQTQFILSEIEKYDKL